jgi:hypothetical protein
MVFGEIQPVVDAGGDAGAGGTARGRAATVVQLSARKNLAIGPELR